MRPTPAPSTHSNFTVFAFGLYGFGFFVAPNMCAREGLQPTPSAPSQVNEARVKQTRRPRHEVSKRHACRIAS